MEKFKNQLKCPEMYSIMQHNIRKQIINDENMVCGEYHLLIEKQGFSNCYKEKCAAWDNEKQCCRKVGE
ncbi:MAG: hypothetical protein Q4C39_04920 [Clostridia bacterium]|nr:hypothetical protein [Clostridia bacterium]